MGGPLRLAILFALPLVASCGGRSVLEGRDSGAASLDATTDTPGPASSFSDAAVETGLASDAREAAGSWAPDGEVSSSPDAPADGPGSPPCTIPPGDGLWTLMASPTQNQLRAV